MMDDSDDRTRVLLLGATGRAGSAILNRLPRSVLTIATVRPGRERASALPGAARVQSVDLEDLASLREATIDIDVVVNAVRLRGGIPPDALVRLHERLVESTDGALIVTVGGAGSLHLPQGRRFADDPRFPPVTLPRGRAHTRLRDHLESGASGSSWAYLVPPPAFDPEGPATGAFTWRAPSSDESAHLSAAISYADYAGAVVDTVLKRRTATWLVGAG